MAQQIKVPIIADASKYHSGLKEAADATDGFTSHLGTAGKLMGGALIGGIAALAAGAGAAIKIGTGAALSMQTANIQLTALTGSAKTANRMLGDAKKMAESGPYRLPEIIESQKNLVRLGLSGDKVTSTLKSTGAAAAALGGGGAKMAQLSNIMARIGTASSVTKMQLTSLTKQGIPAWDMLAKYMHKSVPELQDLVKHGKITGATFLEAFNTEAPKKYGKALEESANQLPNLWARMKQTATDTLGTIMAPILDSATTVMANLLPIVQEQMTKLGPAIQAGVDAMGAFFVGLEPYMKSAIEALVPIIDAGMGGIRTAISKITDPKITGLFKTAFETAGSFVTTAFDGARTAISNFITGISGSGGTIDGWASKFRTLGTDARKVYDNALVPIGKWIADHKELAITAGIAVGGTVAASKGINDLTNALNVLNGAAGIFSGIFAGMGGIATIVGAAIIAVTAAAIYAYFNFDAFREVVDNVASAFKDLYDDIGPVGAVLLALTLPISPLIVGFVMLYRNIDKFRSVVQAIVAPIVATAQAIAGAFMSFIDAVRTAVTFVTTNAPKIWSAIVNALAPIGSWIADNVFPVFVALGELFAAIWERFMQIYNGIIVPIVTAIVAIFKWAWPVIAAAVQAAVDFIKAYVEAGFGILRAIFSAVMDVIGPAWSIFWNGLYNTVSTIFSAIRIFIETILGVIKGIIEIVTGIISGDWSKVWQGIKDVFTSIFGGIRDFAKSVLDGIVDFFRGLGGRLLALVDGVKTAAGKIAGAIVDAFVNVGRDVGAGLSNLGSAIWGALAGAWDAIAGFWNEHLAGKGFEVTLPSFLGGGTIGAKIPELPTFGGSQPYAPYIGKPGTVGAYGRMAEGGIVTRPTLALIGEAGPEAVVPLRGNGGIGGNTIIVNMPPGSDGDDVVDALVRWQRRSGTIPITVAGVA